MSSMAKELNSVTTQAEHASPLPIYGKTLVLLSLFFIYVFGLVVYRLYFSPLRKFPGPRIAAVTSLYAMYYDVFLGGQYIWKIEEMHKRYGPIVRIRPEVLHINDPEYIDEIFAGGAKRRDRYKIAMDAVATPGTLLTTADYDLHRMRRAALNPFFSKQSIMRLEPILHDALATLLQRFEEFQSLQKPVRLVVAFKAFTSDIVYEYAFGERKNDLRHENFNQAFFDEFRKAATSLHLSSYIPSIPAAINAYPSISSRISVPLAYFLALDDKLARAIERIRNESQDTRNSNTIFHGLLNSDLPEEEKSSRRLTMEGRITVEGGTTTSALAISSICFHLLSNPEKLDILKEELARAIPNQESLPRMAQVESLPYLSAVIQEGLRLNPPSTLRMERIAKDNDLFYKDPNGKEYTIPAGTPVGMTTPLLNRNPDLYLSPFEFRPERYLENPHLKTYSTVFSKGTYNCIGMNLSYLEIYLVLATLFRRYDLYDGTGKQIGPTLQLYNTTREDVDMVADFGTYEVKAGSQGPRILVR